MKLLATTLALTALTAPLWAQSYMSIKGGTTEIKDTNLGAVTSGGTTANTKAQFKDGFMGTVAIGTHVNENVRVEFEGGYSKSNLDSAKFGNGKLDMSGKVETYSGMINGYYDFAPSSILRPYVGVGAGATKVSYKKVQLDGGNFVNSSDTVAAGQAMAGLKWQATPVTAATAEYRYVQTGDVNLTDVVGGSRDVKHASHNFLVGIEHKF